MVGPIAHTPSIPDTIRFQPDPGEPAVSVTATPRNTAYLVTAQEQRNETRLRNQALARGEDVLYSYRTFTFGYSNNSPIYSGGLTTVVSRSGKDNSLLHPEIQPAAQQQDNQSVGVASEEEEENTHPESIALQDTNKDEQDLQENRQDLRVQRARVTNQKERAENEANRAARQGDPVEYRQTQSEIRELDRRESEIRREERKVELQRFEKQLEETQQSLLHGIKENAGIAGRILGVRYGESQDSQSSPGRRFDLTA